jgi:hypothetical protein
LESEIGVLISTVDNFLTTGSVASKGTFGSRVDERDVVFT